MTNSHKSGNKSILSAAIALQKGGIALFPTDTVYGICCLPWNLEALNRIYALKNRPMEKKMGLYLSSPQEMTRWIQISERTMECLSRLLPGPFTFIMNRAEQLPFELPEPYFVSTIGVRCPDHSDCRELIRLCGGALAGTSANLSGQPDIWRLADLSQEIEAGVDAMADSGPAHHGAPSTVVDLTRGEGPVILRQGAGILDRAALELLS